MVRIYCTGPVQEWPSDDSDFETENLPGYKKPGAESSESEDNSDDSDYEDSPPANKKRKVVTKMKASAKKQKPGKSRKPTTAGKAKTAVRPHGPAPMTAG